jgi:hypothetical protein
MLIVVPNMFPSKLCIVRNANSKIAFYVSIKLI